MYISIETMSTKVRGIISIVQIYRHSEQDRRNGKSLLKSEYSFLD